MAALRVARGPRTVALDPSVFRRWLERSCAGQGLRVTVTDPQVLAQVAVLLGSRQIHPRSRAVA